MAVGYVKTIWANYVAPALDSINMNKIEQGIYNAHDTLTDIISGNIVVGKAKEAESLPVDNVYPPQLSPIGSLVAFAGATLPYGYLECDGQDVTRVGDYTSLFGVIGTTYGAGNGTTTFTIPDLRGQFIRGLASDDDVDPDGETRVIGSIQTDGTKKHYHFGLGGWQGYGTTPLVEGQTIPSWTAITGYIGGPVFGGDPLAEATTGKSSYPKDEDDTESVDESRPTNMAMYYIIRAL